MSLYRYSKKIISLVIILGLSLSGWPAVAADNPFDQYYGALREAAEKPNGALAEYLTFVSTNDPKVKTIVLQPKYFGGKQHHINLFFEDNSLVRFRIDRGPMVSLAQESRETYRVYSNHQDLLKALILNPTPEMQKALQDLLAPINAATVDKVVTAEKEAGVLDDETPPPMSTWTSWQSTNPPKTGARYKANSSQPPMRTWLGRALTDTGSDVRTITGNLVYGMGAWPALGLNRIARAYNMWGTMIISWAVVTLTILFPVWNIFIGWPISKWGFAALEIGGVNLVWLGIKRLLSQGSAQIVETTGKRLNELRSDSIQNDGNFDWTTITKDIDKIEARPMCNTVLGRIKNFIFY